MGPKSKEYENPSSYKNDEDNDDDGDFVLENVMSEEDIEIETPSRNRKRVSTTRRTPSKPIRSQPLTPSSSKGAGNEPKSQNSSTTRGSAKKQSSKGLEEKLINSYGTHVESLNKGRRLIEIWKYYETAPGQSSFEGQTSSDSKLQTLLNLDGQQLLSYSENPFYLFEVKNLSISFHFESPQQVEPCQPVNPFKENPQKSGFVVNTGIPLSSVSWLPTNKETQFLAVGGMLKFSETTESVFMRTSGRNQIQLWKLENKTNFKSEFILYHDWGSVLQLEWCPTISVEDSILGFLAVVCSDGKLRVLRVPRSPVKFHVFVEQADFTFGFNDSLISCCTWVSPEHGDIHQILVGCSNGYLALWDILSSQECPLFYIPYHDSYIHNVVQCLDDFPWLFLTTAFDCYTRIFDIRDPIIDNRPLSHKRDICYTITWNNMLQSIISCSESQSVVIESLRGTSTQLLDERNGSIISLSNSKFHPFVACAASDGIVTIVNPFRLLGFSHKQKANVHRIFQLEYSEKQDSYRMLDGFRPRLPKAKKLDMYIYPWQIQVNKVEWNGNKGYAGWLASGMACGILRVEDLSAVERR
ncbi:transcription factor TFIIIC complex subunit Sfc6 [Schizosaccharomyces pombe]|uniref:Transcription factor tau subunit sfc6 n=1 Tax=Schizosaccharomyces pombe (strain 972 / ATCC 24843) TaxID=284812 RepID=SFC6_SCHPO|nr:transcription factor TFIIIC subunit Sfc6 [Schizosaccharomyces pombe]O60174.1 RecName: Full=Transcription factor tau subunit sfc6; AltName: Full=TFIIIC subunit sfc6; AltName: Full=Transcription factor C subunit 6 [Schizosaccharomyces pombe 972h-]CAA18865.1 transcription factor TFIIIC complex subunit Sfc6 [Schizosaccharomyces pombe]|eukprot:NP_595930.1 transcription factor TFIIIC subunit Sfc6 [Schizosaccharomyces pombe]